MKKNRNYSMYICVDIGGTNTRVAGALDLDKPIFVGEPIRRRNSTDYEADIAFIVEAARKIGSDTIQGIVDSKQRSGQGRGTNAFAKTKNGWQIVHEHLSKKP